MIKYTFYETLSNDCNGRSVPIGFTFGMIERNCTPLETMLSKGRRLCWVVFYDTPDTTRFGMNTTNGAGEHISTIFNTLIKERKLPIVTQPDAVLFFHAERSGEPMSDFEGVICDWGYDPKRCQYVARNVSWAYTPPLYVEQLTGIDPTKIPPF